MFSTDIEIVRENKYGGQLCIPDDTKQYSFVPGQKFVPRVIDDVTHPANPGDMVVLSDWLAKQLGVSVAFVSQVRTIKEVKRSNGIRQVELLGLPCQWYAIGHFEEYKGKQITDRSWGDIFSDRERRTVMVTDRYGNLHVGKEVLAPILPNQ